MNRLKSPSSAYSPEKRLDLTSRVAIFEGARRGAAGFRKPVTIVRLRPEIAQREPFSARAFIEGAQHLALVSHVGLLQVDDLGISPSGSPFAIAPAMGGRALSALFRGAPCGVLPLAPRVVLRLVACIAGAAHVFAERAGTPLGGLDADAVWVRDGGRVLLLPSAQRRAGVHSAEHADVHALGLLLWQLLVLGREAPAQFEATRASSLPLGGGVIGVVMRALAPSPQERFVDANALAHELVAVADSLPASRRAPPMLSVMPSPTRSVFEPAVVNAAPVDPITIPLPVSQPEVTQVEATAMVARLRCVRGGPGRELDLSAPAARWVVGRSGAADLVVEDPDVSRQHFEIVREPSGAYRIHDLGSKNGLFVNGTPVTEWPLVAGDEVRAGDTVLRFDA